MSQYRYEVERQDYSLYASGNVFVSTPGNPGFPVRLASEILQTCLHLRQAEAPAPERVVLYDPCCGAGYLLATTAFRHWAQIRLLLGSDLDEGALAVAQKNLSLLTADGLAARRDELADAQAREVRASRQTALRGVDELAELQAALAARYPLAYRLSRGDAGEPAEVAAAVGDGLVDVAMVDVPYGGLSDWRGSLGSLGSRDEAVSRLLACLHGVLARGAVVAVVSLKRDTVAHQGYERRRRFKIGKRMVSYLSPRRPRP